MKQIELELYKKHFDSNSILSFYDYNSLQIKSYWQNSPLKTFINEDICAYISRLPFIEEALLNGQTLENGYDRMINGYYSCLLEDKLLIAKDSGIDLHSSLVNLNSYLAFEKPLMRSRVKNERNYINK